VGGVENLIVVATKVPSNIKAELENMARAEGVTVSELVRKILDAYVSRRDLPSLSVERLQKMILVSHFEIMEELYFQRLLLFGLLNELRPDLAQKIKGRFDKTEEDLRKIREALKALEQDDWKGALATLLKIWEGKDIRV
jgi:hypothetical protein